MKMPGVRRTERSAIVIVSVVVLAAVALAFAMNTSAQVSPNGGCPVVTTPPSAKEAPVSGWEYLVIYNSTDGSINSVRVMTTCNWNSGLSQQGLSTSGNSTAIASDVLALGAGYSYVDVTSSPNLAQLVSNGYLNVFYVNPQTGQLTLKPGVTFNSNNQIAYYEGQPITNGTQLPVP